MRDVVVRLALVGSFGVALAGCGSGDRSLATGVQPNGSGGGPVNVTPQPPPTLAIAGALIDAGDVATGPYTGFNATASDAQSALENGTDAQTTTSGPPPADSFAGSHLITFAGNGRGQITFAYGGTVPSLAYTAPLPGAIQPVDYGAIVLFAAISNGATPPSAEAPTINIELTGGAASTAFDTRVACVGQANLAGTPPAPFARYVCKLPAYGATVTQPTQSAVTPSATTGTFTPVATKLYVVLQYPGTTNTASTGNTLLLDTVYAEAGTL